MIASGDASHCSYGLSSWMAKMIMMIPKIVPKIAAGMSQPV